MKKFLLLGFVLITSMAQVQSINGVAVRNNGIITIDKWSCNYIASPPNPNYPNINLPQTCPLRIEFAQDVSPDLLVCQSTNNGQVCKKLGEIFSR